MALDNVAGIAHIGTGFHQQYAGRQQRSGLLLRRPAAASLQALPAVPDQLHIPLQQAAANLALDDLGEGLEAPVQLLYLLTLLRILIVGAYLVVRQVCQLLHSASKLPCMPSLQSCDLRWLENPVMNLACAVWAYMLCCEDSHSKHRELWACVMQCGRAWFGRCWYGGSWRKRPRCWASASAPTRPAQRYENT